MAQETTTTKYKFNRYGSIGIDTGMDKTFPQSDKVEHTKITFHNRYGITLAADLYKPKNTQGRLVAIAVSGPYGAVKEQVSGRYAQTLAERGFLTIAFDPFYYGESGGYASLSYVTRNQHGGFQCGGRLSDIPCGRQSGTYRNLRYLRLGRVCT